MTEFNVMTVEQVAKELQLGIATIRDMIKRGDLPAVKIGKQYRIRRADVEKLLDTEARDK